VNRPKVLLADDHTLFSEGLIRLLSDRFEIVGSVRDGAQLLDAASRLRPDVIVSDVSMPTLSGVDAMAHLKAKRISARVILLTMHADARIAAAALRAGAAGFVLKQSSGDELVTAIDEVLQGRTYLTPALTKEVLALMSEPADGAAITLTPRQQEVLRLVIEGRRMKEIAAALELSPRTVETVKYEMMQALNVHSTAELVRYAIQHQLVQM
jgi:DNA-binding NarL/FixJ family response regulator